MQRPLGVAKVDSAGFEVLDEEECYALLAGASLGRVGVTVGAMPAIFPVNFALVGHHVVFSTGLGTKLTAALAGSVVAFEADWADEAAPPRRGASRPSAARRSSSPAPTWKPPPWSRCAL